MAAELLAKRRLDLAGERLFLPGGEAAEERDRERRHRDRLVDRLVHRPATLARVLGVVGNAGEIRALLLARPLEEVEQPGADDRAVPPEAGDLPEVEPVRARAQKLEALAVGLLSQSRLGRRRSSTSSASEPAVDSTFGSYVSTSWPPRRRRSAMLPPMRPRPIMPILIASLLLS